MNRMTCGHPPSCIISTDEGTNHCGWCEAEARAEAAEGRLEAFKKVSDMAWEIADKKHADLKAKCATAEQRIAELERLVPEADALCEVAEDAALWGLSLEYGSETMYVNEMRALSAAIREYREGKDGKR